MTQSDASAAAVTLTDSTTIQRELMVVDSYYSDSKPVYRWTPKSLLGSPTKRTVQDDIISSSEDAQTGELY